MVLKLNQVEEKMLHGGGKFPLTQHTPVGLNDFREFSISVSKAAFGGLFSLSGS